MPVNGPASVFIVPSSEYDEAIAICDSIQSEAVRDGDLLFVHLAREARARYRRDIPDMTPALEADLLAHDWPGNVRELRNAADRWVLGLWNGFSASSPSGNGAVPADAGTLADQLAICERRIIEDALKRNDGQMKATYEALGLSRKGLYDKIRRLGIESDTGDG